ncbi:MAG: hypothetical protein LC789_14840 [Actinobacteria bacterium]|nr:hypothetical protein [Actinomycetota bacterium]MCA1720110.1 hypothetical protein [Actinomycetota bacterium]
MRISRRAAAPVQPAARPVSISPDDVLRQNERSRGGLLIEEQSPVTVSQVDLGESLVPQIRALLSKS